MARYAWSRVHPKRTANPNADCPKPKDKELRAMVLAAWNSGWWCEWTKKNHVSCCSIPQDDSRGQIVLVANTPSDHRTVPNTRSQFRRAGLKI
jgi:hypothetical protein